MSDASEQSASSPSGGFRTALGLYLGVLVAGITASVAATQQVSDAVLAAVFVGGLATGGILGVLAARLDGDLAIRLGRSRRRRALLYLPGIPGLFGAAAATMAWSPIASTLVATGSSLAVLVLGFVLGGIAQTEYVEAVTADEPTATWGWTPPGGGKVDTFVALGWLSIALVNAAGGNWSAAVVWLLIAVGWIVGGALEGRWQTSWGADPEIRVHEAGLVKRRPFTKAFVPWDEVSHVRLYEDELVLDRGLFDVRLERSELDELEAVRETIERTLETAGSDARSVP
ncbi:hypothetical protein C491_06823 [Natronococcus amylolyticus DSM 10524]|uniref:PH domain-containing protein n=1 Tax=Natronococcus amylolyticus DSM 10524 TaxID=1227497 RepID=L9XFR3_9EURY|nr:hypothetical protein [Natronococcus amylolyticus]ELY59503.1 hypothetical protein C491_06823 [Natronococcus amylolyticus DSM 10524]